MFTLTTRNGPLSLPGDTRCYILGRHTGGDVPSLATLNAPRFTTPARNVRLSPRVLPVKPPALPQLSTHDRERWTYRDALAVLAWQETNARRGTYDPGTVRDVVGGLVRVFFDHTAEVSPDGERWTETRVPGASCEVGASRLDGLHSPRPAALGDVVLLPIAGAWTLAAVTGLA